MKRFVRQPRPHYWLRWERRWIRNLREWSREPLGNSRAPSAKDQAWFWQRDKCSLPACFLRDVQPAEAPPLCAYCDGPLDETSRATIDHFVPESCCPLLGVHWLNLFPCCDRCNSKYKRDQWSDQLLRPDLEDIERYFDFDPETGEMRAAPECGPADARRAEETIRMLGLNDPGRNRARRLRYRELGMMVYPAGKFSLAEIQERIQQGPYRFVAERFRRAVLEAVLEEG